MGGFRSGETKQIKYFVKDGPGFLVEHVEEDVDPRWVRRAHEIKKILVREETPDHNFFPKSTGYETDKNSGRGY